ncbi:hypothetical protein CW304_26755 [Bacillus sp. UFRGS-B20]|nr:hypothetical protein CW304_26755 [Bacillus sp. UFRGS-B20]
MLTYLPTMPAPVATSRRRLLMTRLQLVEPQCKNPSPLACILLNLAYLFLHAAKNCFFFTKLFFTHIIIFFLLFIYIYDSYNYYNSLMYFQNPLSSHFLSYFPFLKINIIFILLLKQKKGYGNFP